MNWFFIALFGPALWSITNYIDKYLITKYFKSGGVGSLIIFSSIFGIVLLPFIYLIEPNVMQIQPLNAFVLIINSIISMIGIIIYLYVIQKDEVSVVVPIFQTVPVFTYILAFIILGETLTTMQISASLLVIAGAVILALDISGKIPKLKTAVLVSMLFSSFLLAVGGVIFKFVALKETFWVSTFWSYVGLTILGIFLYIFIKSYRRQFLSVMHTNRIPVIGLNSLNEIINAVAGITFSYATLLAPIALVGVVNGFQPFFVFVYGVILTLFFPHLGSVSLVKKHLIHKIIAIIIIFLGTYFLNN